MNFLEEVSMAKRVGVILSGCGVMDGSEIHEATLVLYFLDKYGAQIVCIAPDKDQQDVVNHITNESLKEKRNVLLESARIARGNILNIKEVKADELDAVIMPGGFGAAKNLSSFAIDAETCNVDEDVTRLLKKMHAQGKPIAALCIAPALLAKVFGADYHPELTIGNDPQTATKLEKMGAKHINTKVDEIHFDQKNKIITSPCYMLAERITQVAEGIEKSVKKLLEVA
jgi:enhancing lycopene biosynthesis protein 2